MPGVLKSSDPLQEDMALLKQGLNSLLSIQLRNYLCDEIAEIPQGFLYEHPTVTSIISFFQQQDKNGSLRNGTGSDLDNK